MTKKQAIAHLESLLQLTAYYRGFAARSKTETGIKIAIRELRKTNKPKRRKK